MSWGTAGLMWSVLTLVVEYEQAIRYGAISGWSADWLARNSATSCATGENNPG